MRSMKKLVGYGLLASGACAASVMAIPQNAMALGWEPESMVAQTTGTTGMTATNINQTSLATWVQNITTFILGIAIVIFVLKVVLTAIDKMLFQAPDKGGRGGGGGQPTGKGGDGSFTLSNIPLIGAYPPGTEWKDVWIHFGKNIAIVAGAWVLVQIVVGVILFIFGTVTKVS